MQWVPSDFGRYASLGVQLAASVLLGIGIGYLMDMKYDKFPLLTAVCSLVGTGFGFYNLYLQLRNPRKSKGK